MSTIGDSFKLHEKIGKGGFGDVFKCTDEKGKEYAVKCIPIDKNGIPHPLELSVMASIRHPYINSSLKTYIDGGIIYIFMELASSDLSRLVRKDKNPDYVPDPVRIRKWLLSLVLALGCLHQQKIVHADLKASNILLFKDDRIKLSDFSLIVKLWKEDTKYNHTVGTSTHRSLENLLGKEWDFSLDIWSLGVTIYEIIYGELLFPYQGDLGKTKKDHIIERCINCHIDWAERGPRKQICNVIPFKYKYKPFSLASNFHSDPYNINDILLKMLSINPKERPTVTQILSHKYFSGYQRPICTVIGTPTSKVKKSHLEKIITVCNKYSLGSTVISLAIELYARIVKLVVNEKDRERDLKIHSCIWIASKIIRKKFNPNEFSMRRLLDMEHQVATVLDFRLHTSFPSSS